MTDQHPITPPPELIHKWYVMAADAGHDDDGSLWIRPAHLEHVATQAAQWGADQELKACCDHMRDHQWWFVQRPDGTKIHRAVYLHQARRPKPLSLKEQAFYALIDVYNRDKIDDTTYEAIRRALEALGD